MLNSGFHAINAWDKESVLLKFIPPNSRFVITDNSNIVVLIEERQNHAGTAVHLLDRLANIFNQTKSHFTKNRVKMTMTKEDAEKISIILREQSKRLENLAASYNLMAAALSASKDNFIEVVKNDDYLNDILDNPFV